MYSTLISAADLHRCLHSCVVVDCRFDLAKPNVGGEAYAAGHIPGAIYAHLDTDLSSPITPQSGRHPLPAIDQLAMRLAEWGIGNRSRVVAYDADSGMYASRLWWLLRWLGHRSVAVLDGGYRAWVAADFPTDTRVIARDKQSAAIAGTDGMVNTAIRAAQLNLHHAVFFIGGKQLKTQHIL